MFIIFIIICLILYFGWLKNVSFEIQKKLVLLKYPKSIILNYNIVDSSKTIFCMMDNDMSQADEVTKKGIASYTSRLITFKYKLFKPIIVDDIESEEYKTKRKIAVIKYRGGRGGKKEFLSIILRNLKKDDINIITNSELDKEQQTIIFDIPEEYFIMFQTFETGHSDDFIKIDSIDILSFNIGTYVKTSSLVKLVRTISGTDLGQAFLASTDAGRKESVALGNLLWPGFYRVIEKTI
jgi:hypothetical protein